jgi:2,4-dienoyl-CoA reductase-like NADH-dependent reductase (Old Yellow Enzyme family)
MTEATAVHPGGVISPQDLGIWSDDHIPALKAITSAIHQYGAVSAIQLAHAGRKAGTYRPWSPVRGYIPDWPYPRFAPSPIAFRPQAPTPTELATADIRAVIEWFTQTTRRADEAGFQIIELHSAHGYLLHQFLSPISNQRSDEYGGSFENRTRLHRELVIACRQALDSSKSLWMRLSVTDWVDGGWTTEESIRLAKDLQSLGIDLIDCSSGGSTPDAPIPTGPGYQVHLAEEVKSQAGCRTAAVGQITETNQAQQIIASNQADLVMIGRQMLLDPYWATKAAREMGADSPAPPQYQWPF